jgi:hypothetical protein
MKITESALGGLKAGIAGSNLVQALMYDSFSSYVVTSYIRQRPYDG